jgi:hypothetical protein
MVAAAFPCIVSSVNIIKGILLFKRGKIADKEVGSSRDACTALLHMTCMHSPAAHAAHACTALLHMLAAMTAMPCHDCGTPYAGLDVIQGQAWPVCI